MTHYIHRTYGLISMLAMVVLVAHAEEPSLGCTPSVDGVIVEIRGILSDGYATPDPVPDLKSRYAALEKLLVEVGHCSAVVRSHGVEHQNREMVIREWHSINQWLSKVSDAVALSSKGQDADWRREYALFAEIYEFAP